MPTARSMAEAIHQFMAKSSVGVFRARFVVPLSDWPSILEADNNVYDSVSTTIDDSAGRTRVGDGVLVTELMGPRTHHRLLCVTANTASVFVNVLHRLFCGFAGIELEVTARLLVGEEDFESATAANGRGGLVAALDELRRAAAVRIEDGFERFDAYPMAGETAMRIVGRPSAVVRCVCLINEMLCKTTSAAAALLVDPNRQEIRNNLLQNSISRLNEFSWFQPPIDYTRPSPISLSNPVSPTSEPRPTSPYGGILDDDRDINHSPSSPTESSTNWPTVDSRATSPTSSVSCQPVNRNRSPHFAADAENRPTTPFRQLTDWRNANPQQSPSCVTTDDDTAITPGTIPCFFTILNRHMIRNLSSNTGAVDSFNVLNRNRSSFNITRHNELVQNVWNLVLSRYQSPRLATTTTTTLSTRPTSRQSVSERLVNRNPSSRVTAIAAPSTTDRIDTPIRSVSDRLNLKRKQSSSSVTTNTTAASTTATPVQSVSDRLVNRNPSPCVPTNDTTANTDLSSDISIGESEDSSQRDLN